MKMLLGAVWGVLWRPCSSCLTFQPFVFQVCWGSCWSMTSLCPWSWTSQPWRKVRTVLRGHQDRPHCLWCSKRSLSCDSLSPGSVTREPECPPEPCPHPPLLLSDLQSVSLLDKHHAVRRFKVQCFSVVNHLFVASSPSYRAAWEWRLHATTTTKLP